MTDLPESIASCIEERLPELRREFGEEYYRWVSGSPHKCSKCYDCQEEDKVLPAQAVTQDVRLLLAYINHLEAQLPKPPEDPEKASEPAWTDEELLRYITRHSKTELGMTHRDHVSRLLELAGEDPSHIKLSRRQFYYLDYSEVKTMLDRAWERLAAKEGTD